MVSVKNFQDSSTVFYQLDSVADAIVSISPTDSNHDLAASTRNTPSLRCSNSVKGISVFM